MQEISEINPLYITIIENIINYSVSLFHDVNSDTELDTE